MSTKSPLDRYFKLIGIVVIILFIAYLVIKFVNIRLVELKTIEKNEFIMEQLQAKAKLVIWEQDFKLNNLVKAEKKYFDQEWFKFSESVLTTAKGRLGLHIDLADSVGTKIEIGEKEVKIRAPLQLTYLSIDPSTIIQIKESSLDPTLEVSKEDIIRRLSEIAIRENLKPAINKAKREPVRKQEEFLSRLTGRKVNIIITSEQEIESGLKSIYR